MTREYERVECPDCKRTVSMSKAGGIRWHNRPKSGTGYTAYCSGSGKFLPGREERRTRDA